MSTPEMFEQLRDRWQTVVALGGLSPAKARAVVHREAKKRGMKVRTFMLPSGNMLIYRDDLTEEQILARMHEAVDAIDAVEAAVSGSHEEA